MIGSVNGLDLNCVTLDQNRVTLLLFFNHVFDLNLHVIMTTLPAGAALLAFRVINVIVVLLEVVVADSAFAQVLHHLLVDVKVKFYLLRLIACLLHKLVVCNALTRLVQAVDIALVVATVRAVDGDDTIHELSLQFNSLVDI